MSMSALPEVRSAARRRRMRSQERSSRPRGRPRPAPPMLKLPGISRPTRSAPPARVWPRPVRAVTTSQETMIPPSAVAHFTQGAPPLARSTIRASWSLTPFRSICGRMCRWAPPSPRSNEPDRRARNRPRHVPGTAKAFRDSLSNQPYLILAALVTIYIFLGSVV
jgi:hypothetical protein